jgi:hypothetical protein
MTKLQKPLCRTTEARRMPHGFKSTLVLTIYPGAVVEVRESGRRSGLRFDLGELYARASVRAALMQAGKRRVAH